MHSGADRCGYVAIVGRPNVGKSTLLNRLAGARLAAVTEKPQTTRNRILAIKSTATAQMLFVDTPGLHDARSAMNRRMVATARQAAKDADVTILLVDAQTGAGKRDARVAKEVAGGAGARGCLVVAVNKIDLVPRAVLPGLLEAASALAGEAEVVPVSAATGENLGELEKLLLSLLPVGPRLYPDDQLSDQSERFWAQEIIREKLVLLSHQELPYATAVIVDQYREAADRNLIRISATILVDRPTQKAIIIGRGGQQVKRIGKQAREELEKQLGRRVFLELYVKVHKHWNRDPQVLRELGI